MSSGVSGIVSGPAKVWIYPVVALCVVGAPTLAAGWSNAITSGTGQAARIVVDDAPNLVSGFSDTATAPAPADPAPTADQPPAG